MTTLPVDRKILSEIERDIEVRVERREGTLVLVIERSLPQPPALVWRMLTEPALLARWSPIVPDRPLTSVGPAWSRENPEDAQVDVEVLEIEQGHRLAHRWGSELLTWTITPDGAGSRLELRHETASESMIASFAGGWRICLGTLAALGDGDTHERVVGKRAYDYGWQALHDHYQQQFASTIE